MASVTSGTLSVNSATSVSVAGATKGFTVINRTQTGTIWVSVGGTATIAGNDCYPVLGQRTFPASIRTVSISLISNQALEYTVETGLTEEAWASLT